MMLKWVDRHMNQRKPRLRLNSGSSNKHLLSLVGDEGMHSQMIFPDATDSPSSFPNGKGTPNGTHSHHHHLIDALNRVDLNTP
jgi:hypothetical protein